MERTVCNNIPNPAISSRATITLRAITKLYLALLLGSSRRHNLAQLADIF